MRPAGNRLINFVGREAGATLSSTKGGHAMKAILLSAFFLLVAFASNAQTPTARVESAEVEVVKFNWRKERINWDQNPFGGPNESFHEMQFRARAERRASDAKRVNSPEASKLEKDARTDAAIIQAGLLANAPEPGQRWNVVPPAPLYS